MKPSVPALQRRLAALESRQAPRRYLVEVPDRLYADPQALLAALAARGVTWPVVVAPVRILDPEAWAARYAGWCHPA